MKFWIKDRKKEVKIFYDIVPPAVIEGIILAQKKASLWLRGFRLFLKTTKHGMLAVFGLLVLGGLTVWAVIPGEEIKTVNIYPAQFGEDKVNAADSGETGWKNAENVLGVPDISAEGDLEKFSDSNSCSYKSGPYSLILSDFYKKKEADKAEQYTEGELRGVKIKFSFATGEKKSSFEFENNQPKLPVEDTILPAEFPESTASPEPEILPSATPQADLPIVESTPESTPEITPEITPDSTAEPVPSAASDADPSASGAAQEPSSVPESSLPPDLSEASLPQDQVEPVSTKSRLEKILESSFGAFLAKAQEEITPDQTPASSADNLFDSVSPETRGGNLPNIDAKIIVSYSFSEDVWWQTGIISGYSLSNALNGGYFSFDAPLVKNWDDIKNLKIKFEGVVGGETAAVSYLDSVWVEAEYAKVNDKEKESETNDAEIKNISLKKDFKRDENPEFKFQHKKPDKGLLISLGEAIGIIDSQKNIKTTATFINPRGEEEDIQHEVSFDANGGIVLKVIKPQKEFRPGLYKVKMKVEDSGETEEFEQSFKWGVLAINANKSIYTPNKEAYLQMAALKDDGHTICDANLKLEITAPDGVVSSPEVQISGNCGPDNVTDKPDYFAYYQTGEAGNYQMKLANLDNGYEITDSFEVRDYVPFDVERIGPTRIYPLAAYDIVLKIKANQEFKGGIKETVPSSFTITNPQINIKDKNSGQYISYNSRFISQQSGAEKNLLWPDVDLKKGDDLEIRYTFLAPNISPYLYIFNPLEFVDSLAVPRILSETISDNVGPFEIERSGPTETGETNIYQMATKVRVKEDFEGFAADLMPDYFEITSERIFRTTTKNIDNKIAVTKELIRDMNDPSPIDAPVNIHTISDGKLNEVVWQVPWKAGETYDLIFQFNPHGLDPRLIKDFLKFTTAKSIFESQDQNQMDWLKADSSRIFGAEKIIFQESRSWQIASDAATAAKYPGTAVDDSTVGTITWSNPGNVSADDTSYATAGPTDNQITHYIKATNFGFTTTDIPTNSQVDGIAVNVYRYVATASRIRDYSVRIVQEDTISGNNYADTTNYWTNAWVLASYGTGTTDKWGLTWTDANIRASTFGVAFSVNKPTTSTGVYTPTVDYITITVYYTPPITISGTSNAGSGTVKYAINGGTAGAQTGTISGGTWSIASVPPPTAGDIITVWIDAAADTAESTAVAKYNGAATVGSMVLDTNVLSLGSDENQSLTVANLGLYDCIDNEDVMHNASTTSTLLEIEGVGGACANSYTDEKISILSGDTLTISGTETLTTDNIDIIGTLTSGGNSAYNIAGNWANTGVFTASTSTVTFDGTTAQTITTGGTGAGKDFNNVTFSNSYSTPPNITFATNAMTIGGNVTLTQNTSISSTNLALVITGTINGAKTLSISTGSGAVTFSGVVGGSTPIQTLAVTSSSAINLNGGAITLAANYGATFTGPAVLGASTTINISGTAHTVNFTSTINGANTLTISGGANTTATFGGVIGGTTPIRTLAVTATTAINLNGGAITLEANYGATLTGPVVLGAGTTVNVSGTAHTVNFTSTINGANTLTISGGANTTATFGGVIGGTTPIRTLAVTATTAINLNGGAITLETNYGTTFTGPAVLGAATTINVSGTAHTVNFTSTINGANTLTISGGANTTAIFGGVIGGTTPITSLAVNGGGGTNINTTGITTRDVASNTVSFSGPVTLGASTVITTDNTTNDGTITFSSTTNGTYNLTLNAGSAQVTFGNNVGASQSIGVLTKQGSGDLKFSTSTLTCTGLTLSAGTINTLGTDSGAWISTGDVTISSGTLTSTKNTLTIGNNYSNSGTFTANGGTVKMNATSGSKTLSGTMTGTSSFWNLIFDGLSGGWSFGNNAATISNNFTITNGTVTAPANTYDFTIGGNFSNAGTFTHNSGTTTFGSGWSYKKSHVITNNIASELTNYQVKVITNYASGTDSGDTVYLNSKSQADFDDIRFTDANGNLIDYWLESKTDSTTATFWVEVPSIPASSTATIYVLYGNASAASASSITSTFVREIASTTPVKGAWRFDESSGNTTDYSSNSNTGTIVGSPTYSVGKFNNAINLASASSQYVDTGTSSTTDVASLNADFTYAAWVKTSTSASQTIISRGKNSSSVYYPLTYFIIESSGAVTFAFVGTTPNGSSSVTTTETVNDNAWHYVVGVRSGGNIYVYIDGQEKKNGAVTNRTYDAASDKLLIGAIYNADSGGYYQYYFNGSIDEARVYNRALTAMEISDIYGVASINNYGYVTTNYAGKELVRKYASTEPSHTSWGSETMRSLSGTMTAGSSFNNIVFNDTGGAWTFGANSATAAGNFTITAGTVTAPSGDLYIAGNYSNSGTFTHNSGTVTFNGSAAQTITGATTWNNLNIANTCGTPDDTCDVDPGAIQTVAGTLNVSDGQWTPYTGDDYATVNISNAAGIVKPDASASITVSGNWTTVGTFTHNSSTVTFDGADSSTQVISGDATFNNFTASTSGNTAGRTLEFAGSSSNAVAGTWTITGYSGKVITLARKTGDSGVWTINPIAASVTYVTVSNSTNSGVSFCATYSTNGGGNTGWSIGAGASCGITISGTVWTNEAKSANIGSNKTVHLFVNTTDKNTVLTNASGQYSFSNISGVVAGDSVVVYLDGETENGSTVTLALDGTTAIANLDIITAHISLEHRAAGPINNTDLDDIDAVDAGDEDGITISAGNATFAAGFELSIVSGENYTPGGTVTAEDFEAEGTSTFSSGANAVNISSDWEFSATGTFTTSGTVTFDGTLAQTIITGGKTFSALTINNTGTDGANDDITISGALDINGAFSMTNGDLRLDTNNPNVNTADAVTVGSLALVTKGTGTWTFDKAGSQTYTDSTAGIQDIGTVTIGPSTTTTVATASDMKAANLTIGADDTLNITDDTLTITGTGTPFAISAGGTFTVANSTVSYTGNDATNIVSTTYNTLSIGTSNSANITYTALGNIVANNAVNLQSAAATYVNTFDLDNYNLTVGLSSIANSGGISVPIRSTFNQDGGTIIVKSSAAGSATIGGAGTATFWNFTVGTASDNTAYTFSLGGSITVSNDLNITDGGTGTHTLDVSGSSYGITVGGNWTNSDTFTKQSGTATFGSGWSYKKSHVITNNIASELTNYQVKIVTNYGSGTDSGDTVYLNSIPQADFDDIRFTDSNGNLIDYWLESKTDSSTATFWVEVPSIPASSTATIYILYGNAAAASVSSGANTFDFFDDFNRADSGTVGNSWSESSNGNGEILSNRLRIGMDTQVYRTYDARNKIIDVEMEWSNTYENRIYVTGGGSTYSTGLNAGFRIDSATARIYDNTTVKSETTYTPVASTVYRGEVLLKTDYSTEARIWKRDTESRPGSATVSYGAFTPTSTAQSAGIASNTNTGNYHYFDNYRIRQYAATEPSHTSWGSETVRAIIDGGSAFYNIVFNDSGSTAVWLYQNGASTAPNQTTVQNGTPTYLNAKTGTVSVTGGTLNVDWYLGVHAVDAATTATDIDTVGDADITISENSGSPASTVWRHNGTIWGSGATSQTTGTAAAGKNPQPNSDGAIRIREYSMTASATCPGAGCALYNYNIQAAWQSAYGQYDYYADYGGEYLKSCLANTSACNDDSTTSDDTIGVGWYRATAGSMNGVKEYDGVNNPSTQGSWYVGMLSGLNVAIDGTSISFGTLDVVANNLTAVGDVTTTITVTASATSGYTITAWEDGLMACTDAGRCGTETIANFTQGSYADPDPWGTNCMTNAAYCGFGFTSSDTSVEGSNRYNTATEYTFFPNGSGSPVRVADWPDPISGNPYEISYKISVPVTQRPGSYSTTIIYVVTGEY